MTIIKPPKLCRGDGIGLIAPASAPSHDEKIEKGVQYLEHLGYHVLLGKHVSDQHGYLAGTDEDRAADVNAMICNNDVKAIFCIRGGYGTPRILPLVNYRALKQHPKIIVGYSDITALQLAVFRKTGLVTFSGPMTGTEMWNNFDSYTEEHFWRTLTSHRKIGVLKNSDDDPVHILRSGRAHGMLLGGNLSLFTSTMGTPFMPALQNSILVLEDIDEEPHRIDRMLAQLFNGGILSNASALVFGKFTDCNPDDMNEPHLTTEQVQEEYVQKITCPAIRNFQYGHIPRKLTIPFGLQALLDAKLRTLNVLESGVC
ncbi:MAG TPA: LD-carboxypeptidase [Bacteroidota bacterium]|nr:LD-carboxypeptidase [Bacteroidota bacterium]